MSSCHFVYVIGPRTGPFKIGITINVNRRRSISNVGNPQYLFVHYEFKTNDKDEAKKIEREVHYQFSEQHIRGEWFSLSPEDLQKVRQAIHNTRMFTFAPEDWSLSRKTAEEFTPKLCQMTRAALGLSIPTLSAEAGIPEKTLLAFETQERTPVDATIEALKTALEARGVEFIPQGPNKRFKVLL